jgi:hypothetical protein
VLHLLAALLIVVDLCPLVHVQVVQQFCQLDPGQVLGVVLNLDPLLLVEVDVLAQVGVLLQLLHEVLVLPLFPLLLLLGLALALLNHDALLLKPA